ncbi:allophanate hydrolase [Agaribacterium haliotis]|uniref:allophanate hydrolase n=1 Tax=Agaribacterium haliotis TaxID=2013869 RepID=UPI000BB59733|nr:allophanate hydrolase [Agaribacterium haliotis]
MFNLCLQNLRQAYLSGELQVRKLFAELLIQAEQQHEYKAWITLLTMEQLEPYFGALDSADINQLPLYGAPFAIKDNIDLAGVPTTAACEQFRYIPEQSAEVVKNLIAAGAIPLGKSNMDQFATGLVGTRSPWGQAKNVFNKDYISGGSSSGSAIATALGQVSFALGTDTAGSGRVPAAFNNLIGLKPTKGLISTRGVVPACRSLDAVSIFALNCEDAAQVFDIAANYDKHDAYARENTLTNSSRFFSASSKQSLEKNANQGTATKTSFRFAIPQKLNFFGDDECEALFEQSVARLQELGGELTRIDFEPFVKAALLLYEGPWVAERWLATVGSNRVKLDAMLTEIQSIIGGGNQALATEVFAAQYQLAEYKRLCDERISDVDFVLTPTTPTQFTRAEIDAEPIKNNSILGTYTNFMNLLDYSAVAVPVGACKNKVHWGVTLFSYAFNDIKLLNIGAQLQRNLNLSMGATGHALPESSHSGKMHTASPLYAQAKQSKTIDVIVCGAHLSGQALNWQLIERGASIKQRGTSAAAYKLWALRDGKRPAMTRDERNGKKIEIEVWSVPEENFGSFVDGIPAPLGIGKVETSDGLWLSGFICEHSGLEGARDITDFGGWRAWLEYKKQNQN